MKTDYWEEYTNPSTKDLQVQHNKKESKEGNEQATEVKMIRIHQFKGVG